mgnify:CR=1 FL=1
MAIEKSKYKAAISAHFAALRQQSFEVPEWGLTIYYDPLTPRQRDELDALDCGENEMILRAMVKHAKDEDGTPCFTTADLPWLNESAATAVIRAVGLRIITADLMDIKTLGKPTAPKKEP